jgi:iron complex outermembrane receptor protein
MILKNILEAKLWLCFFFLVVFSGTALAQGPLILEGEVSNIDEGAFSMASILNNKESNYYFPIKNLAETSDTLKRELVIPLGIAVIPMRGFMQNPLGSSVYPVSEIGAAELESTNNFSVQDALNQIPGVKMDSRGYNGSRRLSLRGTIARSPFGVRNVRMKVNGFPITSSDGSSALELIEPADIQSMTIYKGPSGSYEMTGTGGVISTKLKSVYKPLAASAELTFGAGIAELLMRTHFSAGFALKKFSARISGVYSNNDGYRTQEANDKKQLTFTADYEVNNRLKYDILGMLYEGYWELPGHITLDDVEEDPTSANPNSVGYNAHVARKRAYIGVHQRADISEKLWNDTWIFGHFSDKLNPYGTFPGFQGLKDETSRELGGRTEFTFMPNLVSYNLKFKLGTQWQNFSNQIEEFNNVLGEKGTLKYDNSTVVTEGLIFASAEYILNDKLTANGQLGYNIYNLDNSGINPSNDANLDYSIKGNTKVLPRVGVNYKLTSTVNTSLSYAQGVGYPSIFEWVDTDSGLFSNTLDAETSDNLELSFKGRKKIGKGEFDWLVSGYSARVTNTITERENEEEITFYENSGESSQLGLEGQVSYSESFGFSAVKVYATFTYNDYALKNDTGSTKLNIAGIPDYVAGFGAQWKRKGLKLDINGRYVSEITTTLGEDYNSETDYLLLNAKAGYSFNKKKPWRYTMELGANNLLDQTYTSFYRLNGNGGKIYNPMAGFNMYASLKVNFN